MDAVCKSAAEALGTVCEPADTAATCKATVKEGA